jgi:hypothetical protein
VPSQTPSPSAPDSKKLNLWNRPHSWLSSAAILQLVFCGLVIIGFVLWINTDIRSVMIEGVDSSLWIIPLSQHLPQLFGSIIGITGALLLLKRKKIGVLVSIGAIPVLVYDYQWVTFIGRPFLAPISLSATTAPAYDANLAYSIFLIIYHVCITAITALLIIGWKLVKR